jgi:predicted DNA-binding helix-hairpin-helix protein
VGTIVQGQTSGAYGMVALSNSQAVWLTGDKTFSAGEVVASLDGMIEATVDVTYLGALYARDLRPIYVQNINTVTRTATTSEAYRLVISI